MRQNGRTSGRWTVGWDRREKVWVACRYAMVVAERPTWREAFDFAAERTTATRDELVAERRALAGR